MMAVFPPRWSPESSDKEKVIHNLFK
jgi:hypothetical protein